MPPLPIRNLALCLAFLELPSALTAQKQPVPGDPTRAVQVFDVRHLIAPATPAANPGAEEKEKGVPLLKDLPLLNHLFRRNKDPRAIRAGMLPLERLARFVRGGIQPALDPGEEIQTLGTGRLMALATPDKLAWISRLLDENRKHGKTPILIDIKVLRMPKAAFDKHVQPLMKAGGKTRTLPVPPQRPQSLTGRTGPLVNAVPQPPEPIPTYALLQDEAARKALLARFERDAEVEQIQAPQLAILPLTQASLSIGAQTTYVKDFEIEVKSNSVIANPVLGTVREGLKFKCTSARTAKGAISSAFRFEISKLKKPISKFAVTLTGIGAPLTIQLPAVRQSSIQAQVELAADQSAVFAIQSTDTERIVLVLKSRVGEAR